MILGVRSALICDHVEGDGAKANYAGVSNGVLQSPFRPGAIYAWLAFQLELDEKPSAGAFHVKAADYDQTFPFEIGPGFWLAGAGFPLLIPVLAEGPLYVAVTAAGRAVRKPWGFKWWLEFAPGAEERAPETVPDILAKCEETARLMKTSFAPTGVGH
jgi:hypothetical protein